MVGLPFMYLGIESIRIRNDELISLDNYDEWLAKVKEVFLCRKQAEAFRKGFSEVIPWEVMDVFSRAEIVRLLSGDMNGVFTIADLEKNVVTGAGCTLAQVEMLFEILVEMNASQRQNFIQFVTGSRYLPVGGLGALKPKLTIAMNIDANQRLPSVMTCVNYLKLPVYASKEVLREKLLYAIADGRMSFDLT
jgi:E3 ubiquitin-protein ligase TRIP12